MLTCLLNQERALGIYRGDDEESVMFTDNDLKSSAPFIKLRRHPTINSVMTQSRKIRQPDFFVLTQIQRQLTSDICWVIVGVFCICIIESATMMSSTAITMATVIYECVSAFANVGGSIGYPDTNTSQAAQYRTLSKLVIILLMYRGRHRGKYRIGWSHCCTGILMQMYYNHRFKVYHQQLIVLSCYPLSN